MKSTSQVTKTFVYCCIVNTYRASRAHVARTAAGVLIVSTVILDSKASGRDDPVAADRELLGIVARPDLNLQSSHLNTTRTDNRDRKCRRNDNSKQRKRERTRTNLVDIIVAQAVALHCVVEVQSVVVVLILALKQILLTSDNHLKVCGEISREHTTYKCTETYNLFVSDNSISSWQNEHKQHNHIHQ